MYSGDHNDHLVNSGSLFSIGNRIVKTIDNSGSVYVVQITDQATSFNNDNDCAINTQLFDADKPLYEFRKLLEHRWAVDLSEYTIWFQGVKCLDESKNLMQLGIGKCEVNVKFTVVVTYNDIKMINILDIIRIHELCSIGSKELSPNRNASQEYVKWIVDKNFKEMQSLYGIPSNPFEWDGEHVRYWMKWVIQTFKLIGIVLSDWPLSGKAICGITYEDYQKNVPFDPFGHFWIHLQILQKYNEVAVQENKMDTAKPIIIENKTSKEEPVQKNELWQFLLGLLIDKAYYEFIRWVNDDGEFYIVQPEVVAKLWGFKKQKPNMTYDKLSRALRYYYNTDIICKVPNKKFVYRFLCDIKEMIGFSPMELNTHMMRV